MAYRVELETRARREFLDLSKEIAQRVAAVFGDLGGNPRPPGAKKLAGVHGCRIRKGDYRILYSVDDEKRLIRVYRVGHRREVYRR